MGFKSTAEPKCQRSSRRDRDTHNFHEDVQYPESILIVRCKILNAVPQCCVDHELYQAKNQNSIASAPSCRSRFSAGFSSSINPATNLRK